MIQILEILFLPEKKLSVQYKWADSIKVNLFTGT